MLEQIQTEQVLFLDIETVPMTRSYDQLPGHFQGLWDKKAATLARNDRILPEETQVSREMFERAGIYAEFGKIICISTALFRNGSLWMKSYSGDDEKQLLSDFSDMLVKASQKTTRYLCAHNGREFDYPYMIRRMLINGIRIPAILDLCMKKPWEVNHLDTMDLWKFGDYKSYTSLELLAALFGIPTPKDDICGADVAKVYYEQNDLPRIVEYCQKDVLTIVNIFLKFKGNKVLAEDMIVYV